MNFESGVSQARVISFVEISEDDTHLKYSGVDYWV